MVLSFFCSFFGGLSFCNNPLTNIIRLLFYAGLIAYFEVMLYLKPSRTLIYIVSAVVSLFLLLIKFVLWLINLIANKSFETTPNEGESKEPKNESPPENFSLEIWNLRDTLLYPSTNIDEVVNDYINAGYDISEILRLYDYLHSEDYNPDDDKHNDTDPPSEKNDQSMNVISLCGKLVRIPFSRNDFDSVFPRNFSLASCIFAILFSYPAQILVFLLRNEMRTREKWFIGVSCGFGLYSILQSPYSDPYVTLLPDVWCSSARVVAISTICGIWYGCLLAKDKSDYINLPFYDWKLKWKIIYPYIDDICRYGLVLYPFWFLTGNLGHPVSFLMSLFESVNRYAFGQNGVAGIYHMIIQFLRGAITTSLIWVVLKYYNSNYALCISLTISSFLGLLPLYKSKQKNYPFILTYPIVASGLAFVISYLVVFVFGDSFKYIKWISFIWFSIFDLILLLFSCNHKYFFIHCRVIKSLPFEPILRLISSTIIAPLYICCCTKNSSLNPIIIALTLTNSVQKAHSESHMFCFVIFISLFTLFYEFDYEDMSSNLAISLLIVEKLETFFPILDLFQHSIDPSDLDDDINDGYALFCNILLSFMSSMPSLSSISKVPSLIWSFITGASFSPPICVSSIFPFQPLILFPGPLRPFYFFDWPLTEEIDIENAIVKGSFEHPVETPVYISVCRALSKQFGLICRQGRLGLVNAGDIFLFKSEGLSAFVHVISVEPDRFKIQLRGLEFKNQTICHQGENRRLVELVDDYVFPNFGAAKTGTHYAVDVRALSVPLNMYNLSVVKLDNALIGTEKHLMKLSYLLSFCWLIKKDEYSDLILETIDPEILDSARDYISIAEENMQKIFDSFGYVNVLEEKMKKYQQLYAIICLHVFNQNVEINYLNIYDSFKGNIHIIDKLDWIYDSTIIYEFINKVIIFGTGILYMGSSGMFSDETEINDICDYVNDFADEYVITRIDSDEFLKTFNDSKKKILSVEDINGEKSILRFTFSITNWNIYQMKHEWIRALWSSDIRTLLFYHNDDRERQSIQFNGRFFNNIIIQACDLPNGYPAFVSEIMDSEINPFKMKNF